MTILTPSPEFTNKRPRVNMKILVTPTPDPSIIKSQGYTAKQMHMALI